LGRRRTWTRETNESSPRDKRGIMNDESSRGTER
jgi:hypothetical protein